MAPPLKFASACPVNRVGGTGGSGFAKDALASQSFGDLLSNYTYEMNRICFAMNHFLLSVTFVQNLLDNFTIIPSGLFSGSVLIINRKMMIMTVMICS